MRGDIIFKKGNGQSKRTLPGEDFISGLILYTGTLPSGFTTNANIKQLFSLYDAEVLGILSDYSDETKAAGSYLVTGAGTTGDTINIKVNEPAGKIVNLGTYTKIVGDSTVSKVGDAIALMINNGTRDHGYTASNNTGTVTITAKAGLGIFLNSGTPIVVTIAGNTTPTLAGTLTQFTGGIASKQAVWHYHIAEFVRTNPAGQLWLGMFPVPSTYTFVEVTALQTAANGKLRQVGIFKDAVYTSADLATIQAVVLANDVRHKPLSVLYSGDLKATTDITTIADLSELSANKVSSIIGQDGSGLGAYLFLTSGKSVTQLGAALGILSLSAVSEDFGNPEKFNLSDGAENDVPAFANGQLLSDPLLSDSALDAIDSKRHIFGQKYVGYEGTYFNDNHCAISLASDYAYINDNRVIDKACRGIYIALIPYLKGKIRKNADGTLSAEAVAFYEAQTLQPLYQMSRDGDLGEVTPEDVYIDPTQNVTATSKLVVNVKLNENGIARMIEVPISYK